MVELNVKPWCNCISRGAWKPQDGWRLDPTCGLWVHPRCGKPSRMNYDRYINKESIIPETRDMAFMKGEVDIYEHEQRQWAKSVISDELGWDDSDDEDY